jgi:hypothetical protein
MNEIVRGTTPTISFGLPFSTGLLSTAFVTVKQRDKTLIEKELSDCQCDGNILTTQLTQEDTLALKIGVPAQIRLVVKTTGGDRHETKDFVVRVSDTHKDEVI